MDLLNILLGSMTSEEAVGAVSQKTGASAQQAEKLIASSIPVLLGELTSNASTQEGAQALAGALNQHTNTGKMALQISDVDEEDGGKIVQHILGNDSSNVIQALSQETQLDEQQVTRGLSSMAPALMSVLSAAMNSSNQAASAGSGLDLSSLFGMFGGSQQNATNSLGLIGSLLGGGAPQPQQSLGIGSLLGGLLGGGAPQPQQSSGLGGLLGGLLGGGAAQPQQTSSGLGGLLGGLLGGGAQQQPQQASASLCDGTQLMSILSALMK